MAAARRPLSLRRLERCLAGFSRLRLLVVGDAMLDEYAAITRKVCTDMKVQLNDLRHAFVDYLKKKDIERYRDLIKRLGLRR